MDEKISKSLEYWKNRLFEAYGEEHILNITLYGSQNYGIDTENSDVDVKAIYIPSLEEAIIRQEHLSKELKNEKNEHCEIKDIREMFRMYKKQNLNFLETLYTDYRWDNPMYKSINDELKRNKERIAHYNPSAAIKSICGQALNAIYTFNKNPSNKKVLAKILHLYLFICKYEEQKDYRSCFYIDKKEKLFGKPAKETLIVLKNQTDSIDVDISFLEKFFKEIFNESNNVKYKKNKKDIDDLLNRLIYNAIVQPAGEQ